MVDFPGVDDRDETIPYLSELLLFLAQVVIFVVDYRLGQYCLHIVYCTACGYSVHFTIRMPVS